VGFRCATGGTPFLAPRCCAAFTVARCPFSAHVRHLASAVLLLNCLPLTLPSGPITNGTPHTEQFLEASLGEVRGLSVDSGFSASAAGAAVNEVGVCVGVDSSVGVSSVVVGV